jgi:hypothetical protein
MNPRQLLGLAGSAVLFVGAFAPIVSVPLAGGLNYFQTGKGEGAAVLLSAAASLVLALLKKYRGLWLTGLVSAAALLFTFIAVMAPKAHHAMKSEATKAKEAVDAALDPLKMQNKLLRLEMAGLQMGRPSALPRAFDGHSWPPAANVAAAVELLEKRNKLLMDSWTPSASAAAEVESLERRIWLLVGGSDTGAASGSAGLTKDTALAARLQWGWALLVVGAALLVCGAATKDRQGANGSGSS